MNIKKLNEQLQWYINTLQKPILNEEEIDGKQISRYVYTTLEEIVQGFEGLKIMAFQTYKRLEEVQSKISTSIYDFDTHDPKLLEFYKNILENQSQLEIGTLLEKSLKQAEEIQKNIDKSLKDEQINK